MKSAEDAAARPQLGPQERPALPRPLGSSAAAGVARSSREGRGAGAAGVRSSSVGSGDGPAGAAPRRQRDTGSPEEQPRSLPAPLERALLLLAALGGFTVIGDAPYPRLSWSLIVVFKEGHLLG